MGIEWFYCEQCDEVRDNDIIKFCSVGGCGCKIYCEECTKRENPFYEEDVYDYIFICEECLRTKTEDKIFLKLVSCYSDELQNLTAKNIKMRIEQYKKNICYKEILLNINKKIKHLQDEIERIEKEEFIINKKCID